MPARVLIAAAAVLLAGVAFTTTARADDQGSNFTGVSIDKNGATSRAGSPGSSGNAAPAAQGSGSSLCPAPDDPEFYFACGGGPAPLCPGGDPAVLSPGIHLTPNAIGPGGRISCGQLPPSSALPPNPTTPEQLAREAASRLTFALPTASMSPPPDKLVVNFGTWLWVDPSAWHTLTATATAGAVSATVSAEPARVVWQMGDGNAVICFDPGRQWTTALPSNATSNCTYTYAANSASQPQGTFTVTTTIYWHLTWLSVGAPGGGDFGLVPGPSTTTQVHVGEIHAINVYPPSS